ncbi:MAG: indole-3-glycerol phosphate synthase TrpC [Vicinamibacterales bacterium]
MTVPSAGESTAAGVDTLSTIVAITRRGLEERRARASLATLQAKAARSRPRADAFIGALRRGAVNIIAECKARSPSRGVLRRDYDPVALARDYESAGAAAISVLTEPQFFGGALDHLTAVRRAVATPLLRKDFIVDAYQLVEARAHGADAVLLIVAALDQETLEHFVRTAGELELATLVEAHTEDEIGRAIRAGARVVGVNSRDLRTMRVSLDATVALGRCLPVGVVGVAESGIGSRRDIDALRAAGYEACLVGERLVTAPRPADALRGLVEPDDE